MHFQELLQRKRIIVRGIVRTIDQGVRATLKSHRGRTRKRAKFENRPLGPTISFNHLAHADESGGSKRGSVRVQ
jgi:hypothetical protein